MCQWFSPTKLRITFETKGKGAFSRDEIDRIVVRDKKGRVVSLDLPTKFVLIANHQVCMSCALLFFPSASFRHLTNSSFILFYRSMLIGGTHGVCCIISAKECTDMCTLH
jgi:hypothetical protein